MALACSRPVLRERRQHGLGGRLQVGHLRQVPDVAVGLDLAVEAGTKYLSGHSDLMLGLVSANARWAKRLRHTFNLFAMGAGPDDAALALRGLRTMALRLREQERAARDIATWLGEQPEVSRALHPALPDHPGHAAAAARRQYCN